MPLQTCLGMDCERASFSKTTSFTARAPISEFRLAVEQKAHQKDGLESVVSALVQQQTILKGVVELQQELRSIVKEQHEELERKLSDLLERREQCDPLIPGAVAIAQEEHLAEEAPAHHDEHIATHGAGEGHGKIYFSNERLPSKTQSAMKCSKEEKTAGPELSDKVPLPPPVTTTVEIVKAPISLATRLVANPIFDAAVGIVIMLNFVTLFCELQWKGYAIAYDLKLRDNDADWSEAEQVFKVIEKLFNGFYLFELICRLVAFRLAFFREFLNVLDGIVVVISTVDSFILDPMAAEGTSQTKVVTLMRLVRILRACRIIRFLRVLRYMRMFSALRVLVKTISMSLDSLIWSMALMGFIIITAAILMVQLNSDFLEDDSQSADMRKWVYTHYGNTARASYTMFEATFSAKWATHLARPLIEDINPWFSAFWVLYTVAVNFAVIRVIAALFLKQTMAVAAIDAEKMAMERVSQRDKVVTTLRTIFAHGDQLQDGVLHRWEFQAMMENKDVLQMFEQLDLEPIEVYMLYDLLSEDDGVADQEEFLAGAMKLKNQARTVDMIQVLHQQSVLKRSVEEIKEGLHHIDCVLHPKNPWTAKQCHFFGASVPITKAAGSQGDD